MRHGLQHVGFAWIASIYLAFTLVAGAVAEAQSFKAQAIARIGDTAGDETIRGIEFGTLNDKGQISFVSAELIVRYTDGTLKPIVIGGAEGPIPEWTQIQGFFSPVSMNQSGNIVFNPGPGPNHSFGTFLWDDGTQKIVPIAVVGMPAGTDLTFAEGGGSVPVLNGSNEIAFAAQVKDQAGKKGTGVFFLGRDGKLMTVARPGQELPGGGFLQDARLPSIDRAGRVAFLARPAGGRFGAYLWGNGTLSQAAAIGANVPGIGKLAAVRGVRLIQENNGMILVASVEGLSGDGIYRLADGTGVVAGVAVPGQEMPGGGKLKTIPPNGGPEQGPMISYASEAGQVAFRADLQDGTAAIYLVDASGKLTLVLKPGSVTEVGRIMRLGGDASFGIGVNSKGQVALPVQTEDGDEMIILLTPA